LAPNGIIYGIPSNANNILTINPISENINPNAISTGLTDSNKYRGGTLAPNGNIYCMNNASTIPIGIINTTTNTFSTLAVTGTYSGAVLGTDGNLYCAPSNLDGTSILKIDTTTNTASYITISAIVTNAYAGGALAPNGNIYFAPRAASSILKLSPPYSSASTIAITGSTAEKYVGAVCGLDGNIYFIPSDEQNVMILNPNTDSIDITSISGLSSDIIKYRTGILFPDGRIFCIPAHATNIGIIKTGSPNQPPWMLGACFNKF